MIWELGERGRENWLSRAPQAAFQQARGCQLAAALQACEAPSLSLDYELPEEVCGGAGRPEPSTSEGHMDIWRGWRLQPSH